MFQTPTPTSFYPWHFLCGLQSVSSTPLLIMFSLLHWLALCTSSFHISLSLALRFAASPLLNQTCYVFPLQSQALAHYKGTKHAKKLKALDTPKSKLKGSVVAKETGNQEVAKGINTSQVPSGTDRKGLSSQHLLFVGFFMDLHIGWQWKPIFVLVLLHTIRNYFSWMDLPLIVSALCWLIWEWLTVECWHTELMEDTQTWEVWGRAPTWKRCTRAQPLPDCTKGNEGISKRSDIYWNKTNSSPKRHVMLLDPDHVSAWQKSSKSKSIHADLMVKSGIKLWSELVHIEHWHILSYSFFFLIT